jgi:hypothetical protein
MNVCSFGSTNIEELMAIIHLKAQACPAGQSCVIRLLHSGKDFQVLRNLNTIEDYLNMQCRNINPSKISRKSMEYR